MADFRYKMRTWLHRMRPTFVILGLLLVTLYIGADCHLRSRGLAEAKKYHGEGLLCVSWDDLFQDVEEAQFDDKMRNHFDRAMVFAPVNWIDRTFCGGQGPVSGFMRGLKK
jgi:hypothetical protein